MPRSTSQATASWSVASCSIDVGLGVIRSAAVRARSTSGVTVTSATLSGNSGIGGELSSGTFAVSAPPDTYTFTVGGIVLSTGDVAQVATGPDTTPCVLPDLACLTYDYFSFATAEQEALLDPITGNQFDHYDVTQLDLEFDVDPGVDTIYFRLAFGSEEYPVFFGTEFNDGFGLIRARDLRLPLTVIAEPGGLQNRWVAELAQPGFQIFERVYSLERRDRETVIAEERLLAQPVLRNVQDRAARPDGGAFGGGLRGRRRNVFELERHDIYIGGEAANGDQVVVMRLDLNIGHLPRGRVCLGREGVDAVAHPARGDGEHAAQLAAA